MCPDGSRLATGLWFPQLQSVLFGSCHSNSSTLKKIPSSGLHCLARTSYVPPATGEYHRPFHLSGWLMLDVSSSFWPNAEYRYPPRLAPPLARSARTFPARSSSEYAVVFVAASLMRSGWSMPSKR